MDLCRYFSCVGCIRYKYNWREFCWNQWSPVLSREPELEILWPTLWQWIWADTSAVWDVTGTNITGENFAEINGVLSCLENLNLKYCDQLSDYGFGQVLQLCRSTLRYLDVSYTNITGENLSEFNITLTWLENLNLSCCKQLSNKGLLQILQLCGSALRSLDVTWSNITGENFAEFKETLPCLKNLDLYCLKQLSNNGFSKILQLCVFKYWLEV